MSGCEVDHIGAGDKGAGIGRVLGWVGGGALGAGILSYFHLAGATPLIGGAAGAAGGAVLLFAAAGAMMGMFVGYAVNWFDRLHPHSPATITMEGCVLCAGRNTGNPTWPHFKDGDWTFNLGGNELRFLGPRDAGLNESEIINRNAPGGGPAFPTKDHRSGHPALHCEISSNIGNYAAVGGVIGAVAGAIAGAAICAALTIATFGLAALACAAIVFAAVLLGGTLGQLIGAGVGWIADELSDFDERGEAISAGCIMIFAGRWVTDSSHQWNEIHDIESAQLVECPPEGCGDSPTTSKQLVAAVGIGRHPTGIDP